MPDTPLNPDAIFTAGDVIHENFGVTRKIDHLACTAIAERAVSAYLAAALPVAQKLTDAEWQAFQAIPDQGYSHRAWVDARIAERVAVAQPEVNSVDELDALPVESVVMDKHGYAYLLVDEDDEFKWSRNGLDAKFPSWGIVFPARVLYRPEVNDGR